MKSQEKEITFDSTNYIKQLQKLGEAINNYGSIQKTCSQREEQMWEKINELTYTFYKAKINEAYWRKYANALQCRKMPIEHMLLGENAKEYLGIAYIHIQNLLSILKEDKKVFLLFMKYLDQNKDFPEEKLNFLADDFISFLFADLSENKKSMSHFLSIFNSIIKVNLINQKFYRIFSMRLMV